METKETASYQLEKGIARRIRQMALQYSDREQRRITQGEVVRRGIALLDKQLAAEIEFEMKEREALK